MISLWFCHLNYLTHKIYLKLVIKRGRYLPCLEKYNNPPSKFFYGYLVVKKRSTYIWVLLFVPLFIVKVTFSIALMIVMTLVMFRDQIWITRYFPTLFSSTTFPICGNHRISTDFRHLELFQTKAIKWIFSNTHTFLVIY